MRHMIRFLPLSAVLLLGACGTMAEGQTQDITLRTPGASIARCTLDTGLRYPIEKDETIQIMRSFHAMEVECFANGNRRKTMTVAAGPNPWSAANVANAVVPGTAYDAASMGLYTYPDVITVDFTGMPIAGYETPDYHNRDYPNPYEQPVENMGPSSVRGPAGTPQYLPRGVEKRGSNMNNNPFANHSGASAKTSAPSAPAPVVTNRPAARPSGSTADELTRSANPTVFNP